MHNTPNIFAPVPLRGTTRVIPGALVILLMLGCSTYARTHSVELHNDTSRPIHANATFEGGNGNLNVPPGGDIRFTSKSAFDVDVSLPDGTHRRVRADDACSPSIRIVEGQSPFTVYVNQR